MNHTIDHFCGSKFWVSFRSAFLHAHDQFCTYLFSPTYIHIYFALSYLHLSSHAVQRESCTAIYNARALSMSLLSPHASIG